jgi:hypothetical protein
MKQSGLEGRASRNSPVDCFSEGASRRAGIITPKGHVKLFVLYLNSPFRGLWGLTHNLQPTTKKSV